MISHGYPTARGGYRTVKPSRLHGTGCLCGQWKEVWLVACGGCWVSLPRDLRGRLMHLRRNKDTRGGQEHQDAIAEAEAIIRQKLSEKSDS